MNFSVYVDPETNEALLRLSRETGKSRNALVVLAVRDYLSRQKQSAWPPAVEAWIRSTEGPTDVAPFETLREELEAPLEPAF